MASVDRVADLVAKLEQRIFSGEFSPGSLLPSERALCGEYAISRSVVREAMNRLVSLDLVQTVHGSGTRVQHPSTRPILRGYQRLLQHGTPNLSHLAQVRLPLETTLTALAAIHRTDEHLARLSKTQEALTSATADLDTLAAADLEFHAILAEASGNPFFGVVLAPMQQLLIESRRQTLGRHGAQLAAGHHAIILAAVEAKDAEGAREAMRMHLETNVQHLIELPTNTVPQDAHATQESNP